MIAAVGSERLRQRADYTYKFNANTGRHGWLRLTPAYSLKIVEALVTVGQPTRVFDPFCGTGTTVLSAVYHGHAGTTTDINPFLVWLAQAKTAHYAPSDVAAAQAAGSAALDLVNRQAVAPAPPIHNLERWWHPPALNFLCALRAALQAVTREGTATHALLLVAFCRILIDLSNAAFNHQSMSFKAEGQLDLALPLDYAGRFAEAVRFVLRGASENPAGRAQVVLGDARQAGQVVSGPFDLVITSPPYANRMSYIRELRPYMYWLGFLHDGRAAGELDWTAIGGTWGIATSRLVDWQRPADCFQSADLHHALEQIAQADNKNGVVLANYVAKYFDDMWAHFQGLPPVLAPNAEVHYIVGNSTFYGTLVPTERLYAEMLTQLGFQAVECRPLRKRNSKKELVEFDVVGKWKNG